MSLSRNVATALLVAGMIPFSVSSAPIAMTSNAVIIDHAPFFSVGPEDSLGSFNFALNHPSFIDIPYAVFDFGTVSSVSSATLSWDFISLFGGSPSASIALYAGSDADGVITTADRFMGSLVSTDVYSGGELGSFDVTGFVNAALATGQYFAVRMEATLAPASLTGYYGGQFGAPSLDAVAGPGGTVPEPSALALLILGLLGLGLSRRR